MTLLCRDDSSQNPATETVHLEETEEYSIQSEAQN